ncbi:MAG: hypothetical protein M3P93_02840 [Actinomycetota bacterium]|nr:hypothetical protein [Actinomycetota bacterium]
MPRHLTPETASALGKRGAQSKKVAAVERRIRELVDSDSVPPLSPEVRDRLALLLRPSA